MYRVERRVTSYGGLHKQETLDLNFDLPSGLCAGSEGGSGSSEVDQIPAEFETHVVAGRKYTRSEAVTRKASRRVSGHRRKDETEVRPRSGSAFRPALAEREAARSEDGCGLILQIFSLGTIRWVYFVRNPSLGISR